MVDTFSGQAGAPSARPSARSSPGLIAGTLAVAAGAILAMISDTMIPEAVEGSHGLTGLITVLGFLAAFFLGQMGG
ncbi:hypothetical protein JQX13_14890 [Archangium violaceum]|uniref:hypothetical protein n=1 Tax=Archangium violaceum TaxID=83451 RepID=UPI00193BA05A|nr:hypothetical protein [Archangium violaceum]QRK11242.1 hypothetical protein JQX13_14890 [Archangium violaceum]